MSFNRAKSVTWETELLRLASQAREQNQVVEPLKIDGRDLAQAYQHCTAITKQHSRTFFMASALLPTPQRRAVRALYAFCRVSDDLVDVASDQQQQRIERWRHECTLAQPPAHNLVALAWADTRTAYRIPGQYAEQLMAGVISDLSRSRYETFAQLTHYCYRVASTVGLMVMHILGHSGPEAMPYAIKLGVALQLTNILRDVREDWLKGRLYLPLEELRLFEISGADIAQGLVNRRWQAFMRFQIQRTRALYAEALPGVALLAPEGRLAVTAAAELYQAILTDIEDHDYDVFSRRAYTSQWQKLIRLPGIWRRCRRYQVSDLKVADAPSQLDFSGSCGAAAPPARPGTTLPLQPDSERKKQPDQE
ncbi:MAG: squalene/phytoene synthase family protein [Anaerolineales bacterium]|nr:squalene/phytoene synthase family protein [Anaerolineales bacterium]MCB8960976.1 squalene/phytoene synthase family protein [Ardenticatenales bacterium]